MTAADRRLSGHVAAAGREADLHVGATVAHDRRDHARVLAEAHELALVERVARRVLLDELLARARKSSSAAAQYGQLGLVLDDGGHQGSEGIYRRACSKPSAGVPCAASSLLLGAVIGLARPWPTGPSGSSWRSVPAR